MKVAAQVTPELLDLLSQLYPNQCPTPGTTLEDVWYLSGQAAVVAFLRDVYDEATTDNILE
jgi:hypothetical protein